MASHIPFTTCEKQRRVWRQVIMSLPWRKYMLTHKHIIIIRERERERERGGGGGGGGGRGGWGGRERGEGGEGGKDNGIPWTLSFRKMHSPVRYIRLRVARRPEKCGKEHKRQMIQALSLFQTVLPVTPPPTHTHTHTHTTHTHTYTHTTPPPPRSAIFHLRVYYPQWLWVPRPPPLHPQWPGPPSDKLIVQNGLLELWYNQAINFLSTQISFHFIVLIHFAHAMKKTPCKIPNNNKHFTKPERIQTNIGYKQTSNTQKGLIINELACGWGKTKAKCVCQG